DAGARCRLVRARQGEVRQGNAVRLRPHPVRGLGDAGGKSRVTDDGGAGRDAVFQQLEGQLGAGRGLADGAGLTLEQLADPGTGGHGKSPSTQGWSAIQWKDNEPGAQTERPGAVGPVRGLLGGTTSSAALFCVDGVIRYYLLFAGASSARRNE